MQNGITALSKIGFREKLHLKEQDVKDILFPIYQSNGEHSRLSSSLFHSISNKVGKDNTKKDGIAKYIYENILDDPHVDPKRLCIYCGINGANKVASYIFPFITTRGKYPNTYSMGNIDSLNFCLKCMLTSFASISRLIFRANRTKGNIEFILWQSVVHYS